MHIATAQDTKEFKNGQTCIAYEYPKPSRAINGALIVIKGRYPDKGYIINEACTELGYILSGSGVIATPNELYTLNTKDQVIIEAGEKYYWEGSLEIFICSTPAWYPEQHKHIEI
jgi:hypothetical protein